jgi:D-glycero-alpha-D-manno-heptose-7-phosphate kinase
MVISRTPLRVSFAGGGSDLPVFYTRYPGYVVSTAINKYVYITVSRKFENKIQAVYSKTEVVDKVDDLKHDLIRAAINLVGLKEHLLVTAIADVPSNGTGLGSSSSFTVGVLNALLAYKNGNNYDNGHFYPPEILAEMACDIELGVCGKQIGKQDQYIAAYGGLKTLNFNQNGMVDVFDVDIDPAVKHTLESRLLLFNTGLNRSTESIFKEQNQGIQDDPYKFGLIKYLTGLAEDFETALSRGQLDEVESIGEMLDLGWKAKEQLAGEISNEQIRSWYRKACEAGAIGGKITGAGGGGFLLLYAPAYTHPAIRKALSELQELPFRFEEQGSRIVYSD